MSNANRTIDLAGTQILKAADGTAAAPSITNDGDLNTGIFFPAADTIAFAKGGTEAMRIISGGRVGIGTTNPEAPLVVSYQGEQGIETGWSTGGQVGFLQCFNRNTTSYDTLHISGSAIVFNTGSATASERLRIDSSGNVLIGATSSPSASVAGIKLTSPINASSSFSLGSFTGNATIIGFVNGNGTIGSISTTANATAYNTSSDHRLKTNLEPISNGIARLKQLPVYRFNWLSDANGNKVDGFVAHEAQAIVPECVTGEKDAVDADGNSIYQGIDQSKIVPLLTAALKEAIAKIETLEAKVAALEAA